MIAHKCGVSLKLNGHNYGTCRTCGKTHINPFQGHNFGIICRKCGKSHGIYPNPKLGKTGYKLSLEARCNISIGHFKYYETHPNFMLGKPNLGTRAKPSWNSGKTYDDIFGETRAESIKRQISQSIKQFWFNKSFGRLETLYGSWAKELNAKLVGKVSDLEFARKCLVEKTANYSYYENTGLREHPYYQPHWNGDKLRMVEAPYI